MGITYITYYIITYIIYVPAFRMFTSFCPKACFSYVTAHEWIDG